MNKKFFENIVLHLTEVGVPDQKFSSQDAEIWASFEGLSFFIDEIELPKGGKSSSQILESFIQKTKFGQDHIICENEFLARCALIKSLESSHFRPTYREANFSYYYGNDGAIYYACMVRSDEGPLKTKYRIVTKKNTPWEGWYEYQTFNICSFSKTN